jgi:DnaJ-class molecular chaperone
MEFKDYYATLGVEKTADAKAIKQAYRRLARKHHPDVNPGDAAAEARFKDLTEAYEVLGDPAKRRKYDELGANWRMYEQAQAQGGADPFAGRWSVDMGGGAQGYRTVSPEQMEELFGNSAPFSDFFTAFFGGGASGPARGRASGGRPGRDMESPVDLTLEEAAAGARRRLSVRGSAAARTVDVRIPAGVQDGARVRVAGEGEQGVQGGPSGDLFLHVRLLPHRHFERRGVDLHTRVEVPVTTAVLGGEVEVPTLAGTPARLKVPPLTQNGRTFRLRGYGMPTSAKADTRGDLYARADVRHPEQVSDEERRHYEALAELARVKASEKTSGSHSAA